MQRTFVLLALCAMVMLAACSSSNSATSSSTTAINHKQVIRAGLLQGATIGDWPMFGYSTGHSSFVDPLVHPLATTGKLLWSQKLGPLFSSAVAGSGMLYIASTNGYLYALDQNTGATAWRTSIGDYLTDSTPDLEGQVLFIAVHSSRLEALSAHTGQVYWTFETGEKIQAPPLVAGTRVLLASRTTIWSLDATTGQLVWKFHRGVDGWPTTGSPTLADNMLYVGLGSATQFWALDLQNGHVVWSFDTHDRITSTALAGTDTVYIATWHGVIFALNRATGAKLWSYSLNSSQNQSVVDGVGGSMALAEGRLYVGDYRGSILCIDALKGKLIWRFATGAQVLATPVVASGLVYAGSSDGYFYALNTRTGRPAWRYHTGEIRSSAIFAANHLYVGSIDGVMYAFT
ncbi:MAG: PQQ-binding-like beta-propeller repeat protein [Ktedonobacteraceae bacterium]